MKRFLEITCVLPSILMLFCLFVFAASADEGRAYYDLGVFAFEDGDFETARANFEKALKLEPDNPFYHHFLGKTHLATDNYREARAHFNKAWKADPNIPGLKYDLAFLEYKTGNYPKGANEFASLVRVAPDNLLAAYYAGICHFYMERYKDALAYFLDTAEKSPTARTNASYYAGICYRKIGKTDRAVEKFEYVRDHAETGALKANAEKWLRVLKAEKREDRPFNLYAKLGWLYDDNVRLESDSADTVADDNDYAVEAFFSGTYRLVARDIFLAGVGYAHHQNWHNDLNDFDITASMPDFFVKYLVNPVTFGFSYRPSYYWVDSESYLRRHRLRPEVSWRIAENLGATFAYDYKDETHFQDPGRDGHANAVSMDVSYGFPGGHGFVFGALGYDKYNASHPDFDYGQLRGKLGVSLLLPWKMTVGLNGRYYKKTYDNVDSSYNVERNDDKYAATLFVTRELSPSWLGVMAEYHYTDNRSNIDTFEYDRSVVAVSLTAEY